MSGIIEKMQAEIDELKRKVDRLEGRNIPYIAPKTDWTKLGKALQSVAKATEERKKPKPTRAEIVERAKRDFEIMSTTYRPGCPSLTFPPSAFDPKSETVEFFVNKEKRIVTVIITYVSVISGRKTPSFRGIAKCAPDDCFNVNIGKAIALRRALGEEVPDAYLNAPAPEGVEVGDKVAWMDDPEDEILTVTKVTAETVEYGDEGYDDLIEFENYECEFRPFVIDDSARYE